MHTSIYTNAYSSYKHNTDIIIQYTHIMYIHNSYIYMYTHKQAVASIWFEIWGVVDPSKKNRFSRQISENVDFFRQFHKKK